MEKTVLTPHRGIALLLALVLLLYPAVLLVQLLTDTLTESVSQVVVLVGLSLVTWVWVIRLYRNGEFTGVKMKPPE